MPKLIDFGDALYVRKDKKYTEFVGTPPYMSPERLADHYGWQLKKADVWAIGVICYEIIAAQRCFDGESQTAIFQKVNDVDWSWPHGMKPSRECRDFVNVKSHASTVSRPHSLANLVIMLLYACVSVSVGYKKPAG